jgi:hypothetical protein
MPLVYGVVRFVIRATFCGLFAFEPPIPEFERPVDFTF